MIFSTNGNRWVIKDILMEKMREHGASEELYNELMEEIDAIWIESEQDSKE